MASAGPGDWLAFAAVVACLLLIDVATRARSHGQVSLRRAWGWTLLWIATALAFGGFVAVRLGQQAGLAYVTAYLLEKSLSVDNLALFALVFAQTGIPPALQGRVLTWGILGAVVFRALLIALGVYALDRFHWLVYPLGALLLYAAVQMLRGRPQERRWAETTCALCTTWIARYVPIFPGLQGARFFIRFDGRWNATPLFVALAAIESADLLFAMDSIPAVLAVTQDPFLVYTSNIFALLGLRSLYVAVGDILDRLRYARAGIAALLAFVAAKMLLSGALEVAPVLSLAVVLAILVAAVAASLLRRGPDDSRRDDR
jgi:tellurite resistance protein TerC